MIWLQCKKGPTREDEVQWKAKQSLRWLDRQKVLANGDEESQAGSM
jgi:hypothetical protein